jgi:hypothetical protein
MSGHCTEDAFDVPDGLTLDVKISVCQVKRASSGGIIVNGNILLIMLWTIRPKSVTRYLQFLGIPNINEADLFQVESFWVSQY